MSDKDDCQKSVAILSLNFVNDNENEICVYVYVYTYT